MSKIWSNRLEKVCIISETEGMQKINSSQDEGSSSKTVRFEKQLLILMCLSCYSPPFVIQNETYLIIEKVDLN